VDYALRESARTPAPAELEHWRRTLAGADPLSGPEPDLSPPLHRTGRAHARTVRLSGPECARIAGLSRVFRCTPFATVLACYAGALHGAGAAPDLVVAIPFSGRMRAEDHRLVGFLVNVLPIRLHCDESTTLTRLLAEVREAYLTASEHADVPYERIVAASVVRRIPRRTQLAQVAYDLHPAPALPDFPGVAAAEWHLEPVATRLEVELHVTFARDGATAHVLASADLFTADTAEYLRAVFGQVVARWPADPGTPLGRVLPAVEEGPS
jgi:non-ribosomal peptide synthetase component F